MWQRAGTHFMAGMDSYPTERTQDDHSIKYVFISKGRIGIIKVIQYQYVQDFLGYSVFNLGFGDYDLTTDNVSDECNSNNGDAYAVFHTVLGTIPEFFEMYPGAMLMIQGSDSAPAFEANCRKTCQRKCTAKCRKRNRRLNAYRAYVDKHFETLNQTYVFYGRIDMEGRRIIELYRPAGQYDTVLLRRRSIIFV